MAFTFDPIFATDPNNAANVAANAAITLFDPADSGMAPITITDVTGAALPNPITVNENGFGPAFVADIDRVAWAGGGFTGYFTSYEGMKAVAVDAVTAAEAAQSAAETAGSTAAAAASASLASAVADAESAQAAAAQSAALVGAPADSAVQTLINGAGTGTRAALDAAYATAGRTPGAVAAGSLGVWDPARFVYNQKPSNTRKLRAMLGGALSGKKSGSILFVGDSTTAGYQGNVVAPELNSLSSYAPAATLRTLFKAGGYAIKGTGPIAANPRGASWTSSASKTDPRYTFTGTWTNQARNINGLIETANGTVEFTDATVIDADIVEFCAPLLNASFEWFVDNVSQGIVVQGSATGALQRYTATGLTPGVHTIKITRTAGTLRLAWCEIRKAGGGVQIGNLGVGGSTTTIWDRTDAYFPGPVINNYLPTVCGHDLGINDWGSTGTANVSVADFKTRSLSILNKQIALGIEPFLITSNPTDAKDYTPYNQAKYEIADELDIWLFDFYELLESYVVSNARGLYSDQTHPEYAGYAVKGQGLYRALTGAL